MWKEKKKDRHRGHGGLFNLIPPTMRGLTGGGREDQLIYEMAPFRLVYRPVREAHEASTGARRCMHQVYEQRRRFATIAAAAVALGVGYHVVFGQNGLTAFEKKKQDSKALARQVDELKQENDALNGHVERLQNDPGAIEHQAREELHYTRPGEVIVTLPIEPETQNR